MSEIHKILENHRAFFNTGTTKDIKFRISALKKLKASIKAHEEEILDALKSDLNKSDFEAYETELGLVYDEIVYTINHISKWARKKRVKTPLIHFLSSSYIYEEPYGTVLIISPWNYPFQLTMIPLIGALSAGNCCIIKPSEYSFNTSEIIEKIIKQVFPRNYVSVIRGGRAANTSLLEEKFDYIFFTGSPSVAHIVMESAAKNLTPLTLELGGKSPCIVEKTADIALAAKRIVWGKYLNAGQTCIAPDYLFVDRKIKDEIIKEIKINITKFYGNSPEKNPDYPKIINQKHFERIISLMKDGNIISGGKINESTKQISPTLIDGINAESPIMKDEIFGPLLPVLTFDSIDEVINFVTERPKPLALYLFTTDKNIMKRTLNEISFGGGCINDTVTHIGNRNLPFGGIGNSGMGQYHGKLSFSTFSHSKSVLKKSNLIDIFLRYPPFKNHLSLLRFVFKK